MSTNVKVSLKDQAIRKYLKSNSVKDYLNKAAENLYADQRVVTTETGGQYVGDKKPVTRVKSTRAIVNINYREQGAKLTQRLKQGNAKAKRAAYIREYYGGGGNGK